MEDGPHVILSLGPSMTLLLPVTAHPASLNWGGIPTLHSRALAPTKRGARNITASSHQLFLVGWNFALCQVRLRERPLLSAPVWPAPAPGLCLLSPAPLCVFSLSVLLPFLFSLFSLLFSFLSFPDDFLPSSLLSAPAGLGQHRRRLKKGGKSRLRHVREKEHKK